MMRTMITRSGNCATIASAEAILPKPSTAATTATAGTTSPHFSTSHTPWLIVGGVPDTAPAWFDRGSSDRIFAGSDDNTANRVLVPGMVKNLWRDRGNPIKPIANQRPPSGRAAFGSRASSATPKPWRALVRKMALSAGFHAACLPSAGSCGDNAREIATLGTLGSDRCGGFLERGQKRHSPHGSAAAPRDGPRWIAGPRRTRRHGCLDRGTGPCSSTPRGTA